MGTGRSSCLDRGVRYNEQGWDLAAVQGWDLAVVQQVHARLTVSAAGAGARVMHGHTAVLQLCPIPSILSACPAGADEGAVYPQAPALQLPDLSAQAPCASRGGHHHSGKGLGWDRGRGVSIRGGREMGGSH